MAEGQIHHRDFFLSTVAEKLGRERRKTVTKPQWTTTPQFEVLKDASQDELVEVLKKHCEVIHTQFIETSSDKLTEKIRGVFEQYEVASVVTWEDERHKEFGLAENLLDKLPQENIDVHIWDPALKEKNIEAAEKADVGITFSDITLAESGTVVLFSSENKGRSVSLLPKTYIAIVPKSTLVPRMTQATAYINKQVKEGKNISSCIDFITGPSNSADIELNLIVGVHGPIKATYILVDE
ncbi:MULTISPECIES: LutC/YkgG family protein [Bacillaceae]|uniref:LutC/YkgG family protein n=1 Tax=Bacillaceae TaxID=186817 RepID=UPI000BFB47DA|nr:MULTISPECIES: lactate utilization protein C [Bacillaceae]PGT84898.1 lactate utilization protein C [Bacillus sp. AFS040349]UGB32034.1 lactate utilization protein C [Metabacillus sp. B2-18]